MEWMDSSECRDIYRKVLHVLSSKSALVVPRDIKDMDSPVIGLWSELQRENKLPKGALTVNCELELQELMRQIDKMVAGKKKEWEREKDGVQSRLGIREKECQMHKSTLEQKHKEIGHLRQQLDNSEKKQRDIVTQYESQLGTVRGEVQKLQREYERLHKRHVKQKREAERDKEKSVGEIQDNMHEVDRLNKKVEDYRMRTKDWEIERRTQQKQIESLEAQRKAISEKCEFVQKHIDDLESNRQSLLEKCTLVQQQAQTYQSQLDKRREILDSTELSLNSQIAQLEAKVNSTTESLKLQNGKVDKLKASLDEAMSSHKKAMDDNEKLLNDLKKSNTQVRKLEELNTEFQAELRARDDFLRMSEEDSKQHAHDLATLEKQVAEKDDVIRSLSETRNRTKSDQVQKLQTQLTETQEQARLSKRSEQTLNAENSQLTDELNEKRVDYENTSKKLEQKKLEIARLEDELCDVKRKLTQAQSKLTSLSGSHDAELDGMKEQLAKVTTDLHNNSSSMGTMTEKTVDLENRLAVELEEVRKKEAELKVANAQADALRLENRHLRQTIIQQTQVNLDLTEKEGNLRELNDSYQKSYKALEQDNVSMKHEMSILQQEVSAMEDQFDSQLQRTLHEAELTFRDEITIEQRRLEEVEQDSDRRVSMLQDRLDSTINRYEEQLHLLRRQKSRLETDLEYERRDGSSYIQPAEIVYEEDEGVMYVNDDMSMTETDSVNEMAYEMPGLGESASEKFLMEEQERARQLESIIDNHIEQLKSKSDEAIKKHKH